ncbi:MAG: ribosomal-processing cysteine protease Prp [Clostridia bacterium]|nr:ribosomal-processing cysteine protease Prp [Clostridia bacterium]MBR6108586.1 ribosomal-processing cysteine protease Prp [Clostridia bacterium]
MTRITVFYNGDSIAGFEAKGHTGYADRGEDIVCAAVSALTQTAYLGLAEYVSPDTQVSQKDGALRVNLPKELAPDRRERAELILGTMLLGLSSVQENYSDYLKIIKKEV